MNDIRLKLPFALDSIFLIKGKTYEIVDRAISWNVENQCEVFDYKMRLFNDFGNWFNVTHQKLISQKYKVIHRELFIKAGLKAF